jgi:uncharacterized membrane protein HdeD (DUF308 family)
MTTELTFENKFTNAVFLLGGIISLVFGVLLLTRTEGTIEVIMLLVGLWWLIEGLFNLLAIFIDRSKWGWKLFSGILGVIAGLLVLNFPLVGGAIYFSVMVIIFGVIGVLFGILGLVAAFQGGGWKSALFGVVSGIIGLLLIFNALLSAKILLWIFAILLIVQGVIALIAGFMYKE